jgi:tellurium resistance protein TerD
MDTATLGISLKKDEKIDLTKTNPGLLLLALGLGWDVNGGNADAFDLDAIALALDANGKLYKGAEGLLFYGKAPSRGAAFDILGGSLKHTGDNLTGAGDGDDETIHVDLAKVPADVQRITLMISIYDAKERGQNFGRIKNSFVRMYDVDTKQEIARYDLQEDFGAFSNIEVGSVYRHNGEWKFEAKGEGKPGTFEDVLKAY